MAVEWDLVPTWDVTPVDWDGGLGPWDVFPVDWDATPNWDSFEPGTTPEPPPPPVPPEEPDDKTVYTTPVPPPHLIDVLFGPVVTRIRRVDIYLSNGTTIWFRDAPLLDGSVSVDQGRAERRMFDLVLDNEERRLDHHPQGFWYDNIVKIYHGIETPTATWETQVGEFMIDDIREAHFPHHLNVKGRDYTKKLINDKLAAATTFPSGRAVSQLVRSLAINGGITKFNLDDDGESLGIDTTFERGVSRWEAIQKVADAHSLEVFFDRFGYLVLRRYRDPATAPVVFSFLTGQRGNLTSFEKASNDSELYNHIVVNGAATANRIPVFGEAENTNPASATSIQRVGRRTLTVDDPLVVSTQQARRRAEQLLRVASLASYEVNLGAILAPWLDVGDAVEFIDPRAVQGQPTRFLLSTLNYPLSLGPMTANGKRLTIVTSTGAEKPPPGGGDPEPPPPPPPGTAPVVTAHPSALLTAQEGTTFTFVAQASGNPSPTVQWQVATSTSGPWTNISGATSTSLTETATAEKDLNYYRAVFTSSAGTATSNPGRLDVVAAPPPPSTSVLGRPRLAWYYFDYNNPPSDAVINIWAPQVSLVVLHPRMTTTRAKIKAVNPSCKVLAAKSLWTAIQTETAAPFSTALSYQQAVAGGWLAQDNVTSPPPAGDSFPMTKEAETFTLVNPQPSGMQIESVRAGFTGSGYISRWYQDGERVRFTYVSSVARTAALKFRHARAPLATSATRQVFVNGSLRGTVTFPGTGADWTTATWVAAGSRPSIDVPLVAGTNTIEVVVPGAGDGIELDNVEITTAVGTEPPPPPPPPGGGTGTGRWEVDAQGNFVDPLGRRTQLVGANAGVQHYAMTSQLPNGQWSFPNGADFKQWGWNCVRLFCATDYAVSGAGSPGPTSLQGLVDRIVAVHNDLAANEIVTIVSDWSVGPGDAPAPGSTTNVDEMVRRVVDAIGDSPWLWIGHINEPSPWPGHPSSYWLSWNNYVYNLVRGRPKGANTWVMADAGSTGQDGAQCVSSGDWAAYAAGKHHVALGWHIYMAGRTASQIETERSTIVNANVPFIVSEFGYQPVAQGTCCGGTYANQRAGSLKIINEWIPQGESALWWHATGDNQSFTLRSPGGPYNNFAMALNEAGQALWNKRTQSRQY